MLCSIAIFLSSCVKDTDEQPNTASGYETGILIINEGAFQNGTGTILHYDRTTKSLSDDIFGLANNNAKVGNVLQSAAAFQGKTYLMVNNANKVVVVDSKTFKYKNEMTIAQPRYFQGINVQKAYISTWDKGVAVVNLNTNTVSKYITAGQGADRMLLDGTNLWVLNSGGLGKDSTISIIDINKNEVTQTLQTGLSPNSLVKSNGTIWVLCGSFYDVTNLGALIEYKDNKVINRFDVPKFSSNLTLSADGKQLLFFANNVIYSKDLSSTNAPTPSINTFGKKNGLNYGYALGVDPRTGTLWCADGSFTQKSTVYLINPTTKSVTDSLKTDIGTNSFIFN